MKHLIMFPLVHISTMKIFSQANGIAHARMGYAVIQPGKRPVYLDCRKRALKGFKVGWGYEIVNPNHKQ